MNDLLRSHIQGCAVGAAVGDALGMPLEFHSKRPEDDLVREMQAGRLPAGSFTDDTEQALALAESLLACRPLDADDFANRLLGWFVAGPADVGGHTSRVLSLIDGGQPWDEAVEAVQRDRPDSAGNGSLMRAWPVALAYWDDLDGLLVDSWQQSRVTHPHPDALAACAFFNVMLYHLLRGVEPDQVLTLASTLVKMDEAFWSMVEAAPDRTRAELKNSGWVRHTLESAVWAVTTTRSFEEALVQVVNLGDDADTAGAVAGALAGACYGLEAIPRRWLDALRGEWPLGSGRLWRADDLISLAGRLSSSGASLEQP